MNNTQTHKPQNTMGFFSFKTMDTNRSIVNNYSELPTFKVVMTDDKGQQWVERDYCGYGVFGGKDYYELVAEMNGYKKEDFKGDSIWEGLRMKGIDIAFSDDAENYIFPSLTECGAYFGGNQPESCPDQGCF